MDVYKLKAAQSHKVAHKVKEDAYKLKVDAHKLQVDVHKLKVDAHKLKVYTSDFIIKVDAHKLKVALSQGLSQGLCTNSIWLHTNSIFLALFYLD